MVEGAKFLLKQASSVRVFSLLFFNVSSFSATASPASRVL